MNTLRNCLRYLFANRFVDSILTFLIYCTGRNTLLFAYNQRGIQKWQNQKVNGEDYFRKKVLPKVFQHVESPLFLDVGANIGEYSNALHKSMPKAIIHAFEPNPNSYKRLCENTQEIDHIKLHNFGLSNIKTKTQIYTDKNDLESSHASLYKEIFSDSKSTSIDIDLDTLDNFCQTNKIERIDLLKIDTEGHELSVFYGATQMLKEKRIRLIQFEFGTTQIHSRVFLKDFYELIGADYNFYRLDTHRLIPLFEYSSINEIFQYQNLIAIRKEEE